ncbi:MAG: M13 family metallopeptidase [Sphingomonadales bacterium]|nr:M13 family metallopeptidase [Sphingomonadales bacterium]MBD3775290.1 M13 family metallopeptidase [Paracoccaceae bacterium]
MIKTIIATSASALALVLATPALAEDAPATDAQVATDAPVMDFGTYGIDTANIDQDIKPGDDFFGYVNEKWLEANPLPPEYSRYGAFTLLGEKSTSDVKTLIDEMVAANPAAGTDERRIVDGYQAYMDTDAIEAAGLTPTYPYLTDIFQATSLDKLTGLWARPGFSSPIGGFVTVDQKAPESYTVYVGVGGLGLPDRAYYLDTSEKGVEIQGKYKAYLAFLLKEAGYSDPENAAQAVYDFEDSIARRIQWDRAVRRNRDLTYTAVTRDELVAMAGKFPVATLIEDSGLGKSDKFVLTQVKPDAERAKELGLSPEVLASMGSGIPGMFGLLADTPVSVLQAWTAAHFLSDNADVLPKRFDDASFAFYGQTLRGQPEQRPRWKRAIGEVEGELGELLGKAYVAKYFPPENKAAMETLVANLRTAMGESIDELAWMSPETKVEAHKKLDMFDPKIGYRPNLETYAGLAMDGSNPLANRMASARWEWQDNISKLGQPIDRTEWGMLPQTVNAYYNPTKNEIVFPAAILQQPFFALTNDPAVNYGAIGAVIGHEMGHGFDDQGAKSDGTGLLRNWWTPQDEAAFKERGDKLVAQYDAYCPLDDGKTCVNGRLTLGENIGDLNGLTIAWRAYKIATAGKEVPVIDGLTGDQRFFIAWAQVWRSQQREDSERQRLRTDPHSPEQFRTNIVRNIDAWYKAFNVQPGDKLYLPPEQRVKIW